MNGQGLLNSWSYFSPAQNQAKGSQATGLISEAFIKLIASVCACFYHLENVIITVSASCVIDNKLII
jgi:hypothetical protein